MKIFIAIIILLIAIQKGGQVPSSSDVSKDITGFINSNNLENCPICCQEILENFSQTICCQKIFHFKCLNDWIILPKKCPLCRQHPFEKCKICLGYLNVDATNVKCCKSQFHKKCLDEWFKKKFYTCPNCKKHLITGVDRCRMCDQFLSVDVTNVNCCENQLHKKCLDEWLTNKEVACPNCDKNLITGFSICKECNQDVIMNIAVAECCKTQLHQECLDKWLTNSIRCHLCEGDLISDFDRSHVCSFCKRMKKNENMNLVLMNCCSIYLCTDCINTNLKTKCLCGGYLVEGITFEDVRKCTQCKERTGKYNYSPRCPQIFCKKCFKHLNKCCVDKPPYCIYCFEEYVKKPFFSWH